MSGSAQTKKRTHEATIEAPSLEEIELPFPRRQRLDDCCGVMAVSTDEVVERLREHGVEDDILQLFRG